MSQDAVPLESFMMSSLVPPLPGVSATPVPAPHEWKSWVEQSLQSLHDWRQEHEREHNL